MRIALIKTKGLFKAIFWGIFIFGNVGALAVFLVVLSGHGEWLAGATIFGVNIFSEGAPVEDSSRFAIAAILSASVIIASALYALGIWLTVVIGASVCNSLLVLVTRNRKT